MPHIEQLKNEINQLEAETTQAPDPNSPDRAKHLEYCAWNTQTYGTRNPTLDEWRSVQQLVADEKRLRDSLKLQPVGETHRHERTRVFIVLKYGSEYETKINPEPNK